MVKAFMIKNQTRVLKAASFEVQSSKGRRGLNKRLGGLTRTLVQETLVSQHHLQESNVRYMTITIMNTYLQGLASEKCSSDPKSRAKNNRSDGIPGKPLGYEGQERSMHVDGAYHEAQRGIGQAQVPNSSNIDIPVRA